MKKKLFYVLLGLGVFISLDSCSTGESAAAAASRMFGGSSQALLFLNCRAVLEDEIEFVFSQPVTVKSISFEPSISVISVENGSTVRVKLEAPQSPGKQITADLLAEDESRNTINVLVPFRTRNNRMPSLIINEVCTEYSNPRTEFIEFKTLTAGNLGGMRVFIHGNTNAARETVYEFLPVEVKAGEYIVLHLRTVEATTKDEYGEDLAESGGRNASPTARDFWIPGNSKLVHRAATAIYVLNQDDMVLDAIMISETADPWWTKDYFAEAAEFLFSQGAWKTMDEKIAGPADAIRSTGSTNTRTICRNETVENSKTAADWYVTVTSGLSPGRPNNPNRFASN